MEKINDLIESIVLYSSTDCGDEELEKEFRELKKKSVEFLNRLSEMKMMFR